jgi:thiamine phosphate synthase YjbQ (UPF0047 family)
MDTLEVRTDRREQLVDITSDVELSIAAAGLTEGACVLWSAHTTGGLTVNEGADPAVAQEAGFGGAPWPPLSPPRG